jgi:hypothetical protein
LFAIFPGVAYFHLLFLSFTSPTQIFAPISSSFVRVSAYPTLIEPFALLVQLIFTVSSPGTLGRVFPFTS